MTELWESERPGARLACAALTPLSWLYALGWQAYLGVYRCGLKRAAEPHTPIVCVGNLVAGGSGKSPVTLAVARTLRQLGWDVVVSCSGYGSPAAEAARLAPTGPLDPREWGDEPAMFRWLAPDLPLVVGRRRVLAAELVHREHPQAVMLMDDGFQHLPLRKHVSIVLDAPGPNQRCLPAGPYREPRRNLKRADLVLPSAEFRVAYSPLEIAAVPGPVQVLCALGRPQGFVQSLRSQGYDPVHAFLLPDHDPLDAPGLLAQTDPSLPIVVTAKDWVKLQTRDDLASREIVVAQRQAVIEPVDAFADWLAERLARVRASRSA